MKLKAVKQKVKGEGCKAEAEDEIKGEDRDHKSKYLRMNAKFEDGRWKVGLNNEHGRLI